MVFRDQAANRRIDLPNEKKKHHNSDGMKSWLSRTHMRYSPILDDLVELYEPSASRPTARLAG
jgi:5,5'-dehydrodivanillate O-demethylase